MSILRKRITGNAAGRTSQEIFFMPINEFAFILRDFFMKRKSRSSLFRAAVCGFLFFPLPVVAQSITLEDAVTITLQNNERVKQYQEKVEQKIRSNNEAWGNFLPSVQLQASANHMNDPLTFDLDPIRQAMIQLQANNEVTFAKLQNPGLTPAQLAAVYGQASAQLNGALPPFVETFKKQDYPDAAFVGVQPLFVGGKLIAAKKFASSELRASEAELQQARDEAARDAINAYLSVVLLNHAIAVRSDVLEGMKRHAQDAERLAQEGLIAPHHKLRAEVAVADAEQNLFQDINRRDIALCALRSVMGMPDNAPLVVNDTLAYHPYTDSAEIFLAEAFERQPILTMIGEKKIAAEQNYNVERAAFLPQIAAFGKYELYPQYLSSLEPRWVVGVQLQYPIFTGLSRVNALQSASHLEREVGYMDDQAHRQVDLWVNKSYREMRNAAMLYERLGPSVALGEENYRVNEKRFEAGLGTSLEVIDARLALEKNQIDRLTAVYDYYKSLTDLCVASGNPGRVLSIWKGKEEHP